MARDREYEKQVRAYTRFIVQNGKAIGGWEYPEDAKDELRAMKEEGRLGDAKIVARSRLAMYGIDPKRPFAAPSAGRHESGGNPRTGSKTRGGAGAGMRLVYLPVNAAWVFLFGDDIRTAQVIALSGEERFIRSRKDAVAAAKRHGLAVSKSGAVTASGPNPFAQEWSAPSSLHRLMKHESGGNPHTGASGKKYPRVQVLVGSGAGWFKPGQYGIVVGENRSGGMHLQDGPGRVSRPGEVAYAVGKSERSGAVWYSGAALRFTGSKPEGASAGKRESGGSQTRDANLKAKIKSLVGGKK